MKRTPYTRLTTDGNIKGTPGALLWVNASNASGNVLQVVFNNATSGTGSPVFQIVVPSYDTKHIVFNGNFFFTTGIRCGTLETGLIVTAGYE